MPKSAASDRLGLTPTRGLMLACFLEGGTLIALLLVAVPLKHLSGQPAMVEIMGPIHGLAFVLYVVLAAYVFSAGRWKGADVLRVLAASIIPFGFLMSLPVLAKNDLRARLAAGEPS